MNHQSALKIREKLRIERAWIKSGDFNEMHFTIRFCLKDYPPIPMLFRLLSRHSKELKFNFNRQLMDLQFPSN